MHITILGKRWRFRWGRHRDIHPRRKFRGVCDPPDKKHKEIVVATDQSELSKLDTLIHEMLHAADWHKDEEWIETVGTDIARALWRLGYRRQTKE